MTMMTKKAAITTLCLHLAPASVELERILGLLQREARSDREYAEQRPAGSRVQQAILSRAEAIEEAIEALVSDNVAAIITDRRLGMHVSIAIARAEGMSHRERVAFETAIWDGALVDAVEE